MFKAKLITTIIVFSTALVVTSIIKNQTRDIEKKIFHLKKSFSLKEKNFKEAELDFFYITSPSIIEQKVEYLDKYKYSPMEYSKIFLSMESFENLKKKFVSQKK